MADKKDIKKEEFKPSFALDKANDGSKIDWANKETRHQEKVKVGNVHPNLGTNEKGVNPVHNRKEPGTSTAGANIKSQFKLNAAGKQNHLKALHQLIHMPKPNLPKSELDKAGTGAVVGGTSTGAPALPKPAMPKISVNMNMGMKKADKGVGGPVEKVDPQTRLPGTLFEKSEPSVASVLEKIQAIEYNLKKADIMAQPIDHHLKGLHKLLKGNPADMQQGVHTPVSPNSGQSHAGAAQQASGVPSIASHTSKLNQLKAMPKPNLPKSELDKSGNNLPVAQPKKIPSLGADAKALGAEFKKPAPNLGAEAKALGTEFKKTTTTEIKKQDASANTPPPPPPSGVQAAQASMRDAFHFGKAQSLEDGLNQPQVLMAEKAPVQHNLKSLRRCLEKTSMTQAATPEPSAPGGPTQDEPKENRMTSENNVEKTDEPKNPEEQPKPKDKINDILDLIERKK